VKPKYMSVLNMNDLVRKVTEKYEVHENIANEIKTLIHHAKSQHLSEEDYELMLITTITCLAHDYALYSAARLATKILEAYGKFVLPED